MVYYYVQFSSSIQTATPLALDPASSSHLFFVVVFGAK